MEPRFQLNMDCFRASNPIRIVTLGSGPRVTIRGWGAGVQIG